MRYSPNSIGLPNCPRDQPRVLLSLPVLFRYLLKPELFGTGQLLSNIGVKLLLYWLFFKHLIFCLWESSSHQLLSVLVSPVSDPVNPGLLICFQWCVLHITGNEGDVVLTVAFKRMTITEDSTSTSRVFG